MSRGFFAIGVFHSKSKENLGTLWRSAAAFGANFLFTVGRRYTHQPTDVGHCTRHIPLFHFQDIDCLKEHVPLGCYLIGVELSEQSIQLPRYSHPERACYLLGAEDHGLNAESLSRCFQVVQIPHAEKCLNVATAGSIVLYDRAVKEAYRR